MKAFSTLSARSGAKASVSRAVTRQSSSVSQGSIIPRRVGIDVARTRQQRSPPARRADTRPFVTYYANQKGLSPSSSDPEPPNTQNHNDSSSEAVDLPDAEYHEIADQYMNTLQLTMEELADRDAQQGLEVEYSAGVFTIVHPDKGTYVLNKQPPNKQIWLSSPVSGPKRFDWVLRTSGGMDSKQDTEGSHGAVGDDGQIGGGQWTYLRDGTTLSQILKDELGVVLSHEGEGDVNLGREGPGASGAGGGTGAAGTPTSGSQAIEG